jgi:hypothetical protein
MDSGSEEAADFTNDTRPTGGQVIGIIEQSAAVVSMAVGAGDGTIPTGTAQDAMRSLTALRAAMSVELAYFPEQVGTDTSPFDKLQSMYRDEFEAVTRAVDRAISDASGAGGDVAAGGARYRFPDPTPPMEF